MLEGLDSPCFNDQPLPFYIVLCNYMIFCQFPKASIHMPRIGYQGGFDRSLWYSVERLLRKYASIYAIKIFVYVCPPLSVYTFICLWLHI